MSLRVFTVPPGTPFVDAVAAGIRDRVGDDPMALAAATVLLPTRRACRSLREAFLRANGGAPTLLPRLRPVGDVDADELAVANAGWEGAADSVLAVPPAIPALRRRLLLSQLVLELDRKRAGGGAMVAEQALFLATELAAFLDQMQIEEISVAALDGIVPDSLAGHWQDTLVFLRIVTEEWPKVLAGHGALDPAERRRRLLDLQVDLWRRAPPATPVIAAGSTGSVPATARLLAAVAALPAGAVILPGLDRDLPDAAWDGLPSTHPQSSMRDLLRRIGVARDKVGDWPAPGVRAGDPRRARLLNHSLRPQAMWSGDEQPWVADATRDLYAMTSAGSEQEARAIALALREALEQPERTAALVTPDRGLARRVAGALARWNVAVDDSGGVPLAETPPGVFFRLIVEMVGQDAAPFPLLSALKHPLAAGGLAPGAFRGLVRALEIACLRGPRQAPGLAALAAATRRVAEADNPELTAAADLLDALVAGAARFAEILAGPARPVGEIVDAHARFAEALAASDTQTGSERLWGGDAGESLAGFVTELVDAGHLLGPVSAARYPALLEALFAGRTVRPRYGSHPRLAILGPLEARLQRYDVMILGGLNEGTWPPEVSADPWMSRPMRADFGLPQPERRIGLSAHDFTQALGADAVYLTRSLRVEGSPTVPARWLTRLDFAAQALGLEPKEMIVRGDKWLTWHRSLAQLEGTAAQAVSDRGRPRPTPPVVARPRKLSVTEIETWMRDPYAIYARHILKLRALPPLDQAPDAADYGSRIHRVLDRFLSQCPPGPLPDDALAQLLATGAEMLAPIRALPAVWTFWWPRFQRIAEWFIETETARRVGVTETHTEVVGKLQLTGPQGPFELIARADRVDRLSDGRLAIIDFKTGAVPGAVEVVAGFAPQLPLEAAIAAAGGFEQVPPGQVGDLEYWRLSGGRVVGAVSSVGGDNPDELAERARAGLSHLIEIFDDPTTPYESRPRANWAPRYSDYEHLARVKEWSAPGADGGDGDGA